MAVETQRVEDFRLTKEPYYLPLGNEVELFESAYHAGLPVMLYPHVANYSPVQADVDLIVYLDEKEVSRGRLTLKP